MSKNSPVLDVRRGPGIVSLVVGTYAVTRDGPNVVLNIPQGTKLAPSMFRRFVSELSALADQLEAERGIDEDEEDHVLGGES